MNVASKPQIGISGLHTVSFGIVPTGVVDKRTVQVDHIIGILSPGEALKVVPAARSSGIKVSLSQQEVFPMIIEFGIDGDVFGKYYSGVSNSFYKEDYDAQSDIVHREYFIPVQVKYGVQTITLTLTFEVYLFKTTDRPVFALTQWKLKLVIPAVVVLILLILRLMNWI